jgi:branched-subunit amino acid aminotransferase/4-amino-4-deoxychorismate lyase
MTGPHVEIDGREPTVERLRAVALAGYGHFTAMQVRDARVRGLDLHLDRLAEANREVFDADLDRDRVRAHVRHALGGRADASVRVVVQRPGRGLPWRSTPVRLSDVDSFAGVFVTNSRGIAAVGQVDDRAVPVDPGLMRRLADAYESVPWDVI